VLKTAFKQDGTAAQLLSDQRYGFAAPVSENAPGVLFDDREHRRETIGRPGCTLAPRSQVTGGVVPFITGGVLAFNCSTTYPP